MTTVAELFGKFANDHIIATLRTALAELEADYLFDGDKTTNLSGFEHALGTIRNLKPTDAEGFTVHVRRDDNGKPRVVGTNPKNPWETYALEFRPWESWLAMPVAQDTIDEFGEAKTVALVLNEMCWVAYEQDAIRAAADELKELSESMKDGTAKSYSMEEVMERARQVLQGRAADGNEPQ